MSRPPAAGSTTRRAAQPATAGGGPATAFQTTPSTSHVYRESPLDAILAEQGLSRYHLAPPSWRAPWTVEAPDATTGSAGASTLGRSAGRAGGAGSAAAGPGGAVDDSQIKAWPVFYPPRDGMDEDQMTEHAVKAGYVSKGIVQAETFSAHQHIHDKLKTTDILGNLSRLISAVQTRSQQSLPTYGPSTFRLPSRITLTDAKREAWFSDLASPSIPLSKLSRSVPHGYKGEKGLDMLAHRKVDVPRAVWFVRAFGGVEIQSLAKTRPTSVAISLYTSEFTTVVSEFIRKQLVEVVLPFRPSSGGVVTTPAATPLPAPSTPSANPTRARSASTSSNAAAAAAKAAAAAAAGPGLMDEEKRKAWEGKFEYTIRLVSSLYEEALLDRPQFLRYLIGLLDPSPSTSLSTLGQLSFVLLLVEDHLGDVLASETSTARLVRGCLLRLQELDAAPSTTLRQTLTASLISLVRSAFLANPDAFIPLLPSPIYPLSRIPPSPSENLGERLERLLVHGGAGGTDEDPVLRQTIQADLEELKLRRAYPSAALAARAAQPAAELSVTPSPSTAAAGANDRALLATIKRLDEIEFPVKMRDVHRALFSPSSSATTPPTPSPISHDMINSHSTSSSQPSSSSRTRPTASSASPSPLPITLAHALPLFFTWATTPTRPSGAHRRYAVARLIALELERQSSSAPSSSSSAATAKASRASARLSAKRSGSLSTGVEDAFVRWVDEQFPHASTAPPVTPAPSTPHPAAAAAAAGGGAGPIRREDVRLLAEELIRAGVLHYGAYLQRMIARGETEARPDVEEEEGETVEPSLHLWILRTVPLAVETGGPAGAANAAGGARRRVAIGGKQGIEQTLKTEERLRVVKAELQRLAFGSATDGGGDVRPLLRTVSELVEDGAQWAITRDVVPDGLSARVDLTTGEVKVSKEQLAVVVAVYEVAQDWWGLLQLLLVMLHRLPRPPLLDHILDTLERHLDLWTALDGLSELGTALSAVYQPLKSTSDTDKVTQRRLLTLLHPFSSSDLLPAKVKQLVHIESHTLLSTPATPLDHHPLVTPIGELQSLFVDSSPIAIDQVASTITSRYSGYDNWGSVALDGLVQLLPRLGSVEPAVDLARALQERSTASIEYGLVAWIAAMTPEQLVETFGGPASGFLPDFLAGLVLSGLVSAAVAVKDVVFPAWSAVLGPHAAAAVDSPTLDLDPSVLAAIGALHATIAALILPSEEALQVSWTSTDVDVDSASPSQSPSTLALSQRQAARRASLFTSTRLFVLAQLFAFLSVEQDVLTAAGHPDLAESTGALFLRLAGLSELLAVVLRDPAAFRNSMLEGIVLKGLPRVEAYRPKLLGGVLVVLKDGGAETPANLASTEDWDLFLSGLTLWRLPVSKVEVEACLERLDLDMSLSATEKSEALHALSQHFVERVCSGEGQSCLGEQVVKCYHGSASDELVSVAFSRLGGAFTSLSAPDLPDEDRLSALTTLRCATRLLDTLLRSVSQAASRSAALEELLKGVKLFLSQERLGTVKEKSVQTTETQYVVFYVAHLLVIALRCTVKPAEKTTVELYRDCLAASAKLATAFARGRAHDCELSTILLDSTAHILYSLSDLHPTPRPPTLQNLLAAPPPPPAAASASQPPPLSLDLVPDSTFSRLTRLFGPSAPTTSVPNPWELLDHTDPSSAASRRTASTPSYAPHPPLTNLGPIDLAAFRARVVETIPAVTALDALSTVSSSSTLSLSTPAFEKGRQTNFDFETPCIGLSAAAKDHRRTTSVTRALRARIEAGGAAAAAAAHAQAQAQAAAQAKKRAAAASAAASPAAATPAAATPGQLPPPPPPLNASASSTGSTSVAATGRGTKRKASAATNEIVLDQSDEEDGGASGKGKKQDAPAKKKAKAGSSGGAVGGKTVAGKTVAGKTVAGKGKKKK
ncbi:hypothetical protein JCM8097_004834 [Rhodosporidiobolus ruineniae]